MSEEIKQEQQEERQEVKQETVQETIPEQAVTKETAGEEIAQTEGNGKKKLGKKQWGIIGAVAAVVLALAIGLGIYNAPVNRLNRQLSLGNKYLEEQKYEEAALAFEQAIAIDDRCMQAYAGGIEAYLNTGDTENLEKMYEKAMGVIGELDEEFLTENMDAVVDIYLYADEVYGNTEKAAQILEEAMEITGQNPEIEEELVNVYLELAEKYTGDGAHEKALECYDRLLELAGENEQVLTGLESCLKQYIDVLMEEKRYDEIRKLAEKYGNVVKNIDFEAILARIAELERIEAENRAFMQKVYELMEAKDYESMHGVDGSEEATAFVERMTGEFYSYIPEDSESRNGTGAGVYKFGEGGYYFFYGQYEDGKRAGNGVSFCNSTKGGYEVFTGEWKEDAPNGQGEIVTSYDTFATSGGAFSATLRGNFVNGLCDGDIERIITSGGQEFDVSFSADNGVPVEDKTEEFYEMRPWADEIPDNAYVYAYDIKGDRYVWSWVETDETIGVVGYED